MTTHPSNNTDIAVHHWPQCFLLLDDGHSKAPARRSRIYLGPASGVEATCPAELGPALRWIDAEHRAGRHLVLTLSYELGWVFQGMPDLAEEPSTGRWPSPLLRAFSMPAPQHLSAEAIRAQIDMRRLLKWAGARALAAADQPTALLDWQGLDAPAQKHFEACVEIIREAIARGETYQVNHTIDALARFSEPCLHDHPGIDLYAQLRERQPAAYSAYLPGTPGQGPLLCHSPEAFVWGRLGGQVFARPMKGTAPLTSSPEGLRSDDKNRAENLMIVDLLRNDLGQVAVPGSVSVPSLFDVEPVGDLWQMTSTISAQLQPGLGLAQVLQALHPCGSITGAPKRKTMEIIRALEQRPRGAYCGSLGWLDPNGDFCLNVVIRSLELAPETHHCRLGLGAGITHSSRGSTEWQEVISKGRFATGMPSPVGLFETLRVSEGGDIDRLSAHLERLRRSATALGIRWSETDIQVALTQARRQQTAEGLQGRPCRLRIDLASDGQVSAVVSAMSDLAPCDARGQRKLFWATDLLGPEARTQAGHPLLAHKTTARSLYDAGWRAAEMHGGIDALFENHRGEVTEGGRTSLFALIDGRWLTPPLTAGVLPGIARQAWLDGELQRQGPLFGGRLMRLGEPAQEARLTRDMVMAAEQLVVVNSLRGAMAVALATPQSAASANTPVAT